MIHSNTHGSSQTRTDTSSTDSSTSSVDCLASAPMAADNCANGSMSADYRGRLPGLACEGRTCRATPKCCHNRADRLAGSNCCLVLSSTCFLFAVADCCLSRASVAETANSQGNGKYLDRQTWLVATKSSRCSPIHTGACSNRRFL